MPFAFMIVGLVLVVTGLQNTYATLGAQLQKDLFGPQGFIVWAIALIFVGLLGYVQELAKFSRWFLALILIAIILAQYKNGKNIAQLFVNQLKNPTSPNVNTNAPAQSPAVTSTNPSASTPTNPLSWHLPTLSDILKGMSNGPGTNLF